MAKVTERKISEYMPDPHNANAGTERGQYMLDTSVEQVGLARSVVSTADDVLPAGNKTLQAAIDAGITDVIEVETDGHQLVVVKRKDWESIDNPQARQYAYFDNRTGEVGLAWDAAQILDDINSGIDLASMWKPGELEALLESARPEPAGDSGAAMDRAAELQKKWQTELGQIWQVGQHRVMCGDSTSAKDVAALMDGALAELIWTDPPYGVAYEGKTADALTIEGDKPANLLPTLINAFKLADGASIESAPFYIAHPAGALSLTFGDAICQVQWKLHQTLVWVKNRIVLGYSDYHYQHEPIFYGWTSGNRRVSRGAANQLWYGGADQSTVLEFPSPQRNGEHPTMKPPELVALCIRNSSGHGDIVYDPFLGSGTTAVAAEQLGRICYGMEIAPQYVAVILERLAGMGLTPELVEQK